MPWTVTAKPPISMLGRVGWPFPNGYFPRRFHYLKDATELKVLALKAGAADVRVERSKRGAND